MREHKLISLGVNLIRFADEDVKTETEAVLQALEEKSEKE
jgi:very-short-patch-repair endonuclease